jgi:hypothetical protein
MTKTIRLKLDHPLVRKLEAVTDFHGEESIEDTICLLIRYAHADMLRFADEEFGQNGAKVPPQGPEPDDEIPM